MALVMALMMALVMALLAPVFALVWLVCLDSDEGGWKADLLSLIGTLNLTMAFGTTMEG